MRIICPICKKDLTGNDHILGISEKHLKRLHADVHAREGVYKIFMAMDQLERNDISVTTLFEHRDEYRKMEDTLIAWINATS